MKLPKLKCTAIFLAGIFIVLIPAIACTARLIVELGASGGTNSVTQAINNYG